MVVVDMVMGLVVDTARKQSLRPKVCESGCRGWVRVRWVGQGAEDGSGCGGCRAKTVKQVQCNKGAAGAAWCKYIRRSAAQRLARGCSALELPALPYVRENKKNTWKQEHIQPRIR